MALCVPSTGPRSIEAIATQRVDDLNSSLPRQVGKVALGLFSAIPIVAVSSKPLQEGIGFFPALFVEAFVGVATVLTVRRFAGRILRCCSCTQAAVRRQIFTDSKKLPFDRFWEAYQLGKRDLSTMEDPLLPITTIEDVLVTEFRKKMERSDMDTLLNEYRKYFGEGGLGRHPQSRFRRPEDLYQRVSQSEGVPFTLSLPPSRHPNLSVSFGNPSNSG